MLHGHCVVGETGHEAPTGGDDLAIIDGVVEDQIGRLHDVADLEDQMGFFVHGPYRRAIR
jgi:hypothetical protein